MISHIPEDLEFGRQLASKNRYTFSFTTKRDDVRRLLVSYPGSLVFWNAENTAQYEGSVEVLPKYARPQRVFAITEKSLYVYPHLYKQPIYGHYLYRRFDPAALEIYSYIANSAIAADSNARLGLNRYLPEKSVPNEIWISRSVHKRAAIEAIQNSLTKQGVKGRLAALVAQATDELILNAIFASRQYEDRDADFTLSDKERVKVEVGYGLQYVGICVTDQFGTLTKKVFMDSLQKHLEKEGTESTVADVEETGLGLHGLVRSGLSLLFASKPKASTQMMLFFPKVSSYKDFRMGFRFLSIFD